MNLSLIRHLNSHSPQQRQGSPTLRIIVYLQRPIQSQPKSLTRTIRSRTRTTRHQSAPLRITTLLIQSLTTDNLPFNSLHLAAVRTLTRNANAYITQVNRQEAPRFRRLFIRLHRFNSQRVHLTTCLSRVQNPQRGHKSHKSRPNIMNRILARTTIATHNRYNRPTIAMRRISNRPISLRLTRRKQRIPRILLSPNQPNTRLNRTRNIIRTRRPLRILSKLRRIQPNAASHLHQKVNPLRLQGTLLRVTRFSRGFIMLNVQRP